MLRKETSSIVTCQIIMNNSNQGIQLASWLVRLCNGCYGNDPIPEDSWATTEAQRRTATVQKWWGDRTKWSSQCVCVCDLTCASRSTRTGRGGASSSGCSSSSLCNTIGRVYQWYGITLLPVHPSIHSFRTAISLFGISNGRGNQFYFVVLFNSNWRKSDVFKFVLNIYFVF